MGGTGAMGLHLKNSLLDLGHDVYITSRKKYKSSANLTYLLLDAKSDEFVEYIKINHFDVIVDFMIYSTKSFTDRVKYLQEATHQYIFISSARVYANSKKEIREDNPRLLDTIKDQSYLDSDEYAIAKARQENVLFDSSMNNWTIIRPYITFSRDRLQLGFLEKEEWLFRALNNKPIIFSKEVISKITTMTDGHDVSKAITSIIGERGSLGQAFHITHSKSILWQDVVDVYLKELKKSGIDDVKIILQSNDEINWHESFRQIEYDRMYNRKFNNEKISQYIDVNSFSDPLNSLGDYLQEFLEKLDFKTINWKSEAKKDKACKVHSSILEIQGIKNKVKYVLFRYLIK